VPGGLDAVGQFPADRCLICNDGKNCAEKGTDDSSLKKTEKKGDPWTEGEFSANVCRKNEAQRRKSRGEGGENTVLWPAEEEK